MKFVTAPAVADLDAVLNGKAPATIDGLSSVTVGTFSTRKPAPPRQDSMTDSAAKARVIEGFSTALMRIAGVAPESREKEYAALISGAVPTAILQRTGRGRVTTVEAFREMLGQLHSMRGPVRPACNGTKQLIFFNVPRGWEAFVGEVVDAELISTALRRDRSMEVNAAREAKTKCPVPANATEYTIETAPPYLATMLKHVKVTGVFRSFENSDEGPKQVWKFSLSCPVMEQPAAQSLCFVIDVKTGELLTWQPGRYTQDLPAHLRSSRVSVGELESGAEE